MKVLFDGKQGDIVNQYVEFTKIYQEQLKLYNRTRKTVLETIKICKNKNVLKEYLEKRESEVVTIMMTLFDTEYTFKTYVDSEKREAEEKGGIKATIKVCKDYGASVSETVKRIVNDFGLSVADAETKVKECWEQ